MARLHLYPAPTCIASVAIHDKGNMRQEEFRRQRRRRRRRRGVVVVEESEQRPNHVRNQERCEKVVKNDQNH